MSRDILDNFEEVGNRCDIIYTCDRCDQYEYPSDSDGEVGHVRMFKVHTGGIEFGDTILCEYCLRRRLMAVPGES